VCERDIVEMSTIGRTGRGVGRDLANANYKEILTTAEQVKSKSD